MECGVRLPDGRTETSGFLARPCAPISVGRQCVKARRLLLDRSKSACIYVSARHGTTDQLSRDRAPLLHYHWLLVIGSTDIITIDCASWWRPTTTRTRDFLSLTTQLSRAVLDRQIANMLTNRNKLFTNAFKPFSSNIIHIDVVYDKIYLDIFINYWL